MTIQTRPYDAANYLRNDADCAGYLSAVMTDAPASSEEIAAALADVVRARGMLQSPNQTLFGQGTAALDALLKTIRTLGLRLTVQSDLSPDTLRNVNPRPAAD